MHTTVQTTPCTSLAVATPLHELLADADARHTQPALAGIAALTTADHTRPADTDRITHQAAAVYVAAQIHAAATMDPDPAATLDDIADALPEVLPQVFTTMGTDPGLAETLLPEVADRVWAYTVVEHARAEAGTDYGYVFELLADELKCGANPAAIRTQVPGVLRRVYAAKAGA
ncbi:hypothetical protein ACIQ9J_26010 [Streptomyces sp. NPDC094153]|uniref:hypothetical protein n=1 Tax=Streptomyces sp. NPDC094153 TaxID=3366058 RepID=UPI00381175C3